MNTSNSSTWRCLLGCFLFNLFGFFERRMRKSKPDDNVDQSRGTEKILQPRIACVLSEFARLLHIGIACMQSATARNSLLSYLARIQFLCSAHMQTLRVSKNPLSEGGMNDLRRYAVSALLLHCVDRKKQLLALCCHSLVVSCTPTKVCHVSAWL